MSDEAAQPRVLVIGAGKPKTWYMSSGTRDPDMNKALSVCWLRKG